MRKTKRHWLNIAALDLDVILDGRRTGVPARSDPLVGRRHVF